MNILWGLFQNTIHGNTGLGEVGMTLLYVILSGTFGQLYLLLLKPSILWVKKPCFPEGWYVIKGSDYTLKCSCHTIQYSNLCMPREQDHNHSVPIVWSPGGGRVALQPAGRKEHLAHAMQWGSPCCPFLVSTENWQEQNDVWGRHGNQGLWGRGFRMHQAVCLDQRGMGWSAGEGGSSISDWDPVQLQQLWLPHKYPQLPQEQRSAMILGSLALKWSHTFLKKI